MLTCVCSVMDHRWTRPRDMKYSSVSEELPEQLQPSTGNKRQGKWAIRQKCQRFRVLEDQLKWWQEPESKVTKFGERMKLKNGKGSIRSLWEKNKTSSMKWPGLSIERMRLSANRRKETVNLKTMLTILRNLIIMVSRQSTNKNLY